MSSSKHKILTLSLTIETIKQIEKYLARYSSRSEFFRFAIIQYINNYLLEQKNKQINEIINKIKKSDENG